MRTPQRIATQLARLLGAMMLVIVACIRETTAPGTIDPNDILLTIVSGSGQTGTVGTTLPTGLIVKATNSSGTALPNIVVNFEITAGGGTMYADAVETASDGTAEDYWTLGPTAGTQSVEVRRIDPSTKARQSFGTFTATATAAASAKLVVVAGAQQDGYSSTAVSAVPTVKVTDLFGNPKSGVSVAFTVGTGGGTVTGTSGTNVRTTTQTTASDGTAKPTAWTLGGTPSINSLTASSGSLSGSPATFLANALFSVKAISSGGLRTCELRADGAPYCTGFNDFGDFGTGNNTSWHQMTPAAGGIAFSVISTGNEETTCGVTPNGDAYCWGSNINGQLGDGVVGGSISSPIKTKGSLKFKTLSVGSAHVCAIATSAKAYCWGSNFSGQLGIDNSGGNRDTAVLVSTTQSFAQISAGSETTCGVTTTGVGLCWGDNTFGEVGDGGTEAAPGPEVVLGNHVWRQISVGNTHACGVTTGNVVYCWGQLDQGLGNGTTQSFSPVAVSGSLAFQQVQASVRSTCALTTGGNIYCWGDNAVGQLGDGTTTPHPTPTLIPTGPTFASLGAAGGRGQCAIAKGGGPAWCWGDNTEGSIGTGSSDTQLSPARVLNP